MKYRKEIEEWVVENKFLVIFSFIFFVLFYKHYLRLWINKNISKLLNNYLVYRYVKTESEEELNKRVKEIREKQSKKLN
jgi:hypothetical protein